MRSALVLIGVLLASLCVSAAHSSAEGGAGGHHRITLEEFSISVPADWSVSVSESGSKAPDSLVWTANVPPLEHVSDTVPPDELLRALPARGIVVLVEASPERPCAADGSLRLKATDILGSSYEGQPSPHVSSGSTYAIRDGLCLFAQAWFGVNEPTDDMLAQVDQILLSVELPTAKPDSTS